MKGFFIFLIFSVSFFKKENKFVLKIEPEKPQPEEKITIHLSRNFSGYFWYLEFSGGDPYRVIPHVEKIDNKNKISITSYDKNTALILFLFEDKKGKFIFDSTFYIIYYTKDKPMPYALSLLGYLYFSRESRFPDFQKFESLWLKEKEYYKDHYDFMDNLYDFMLNTGKKKIEDIKKEIKENLEKEKNNSSYLYAAYLTSKWVLEDTILMEEIMKNIENLPDDNHKIAAKFNYMLEVKGNFYEFISYIKNKKLDPLIPHFRRFLNTIIVKKYLSQPESLIIWIEEREKEGFESIDGIVYYVHQQKELLKGKGYEPLYKWLSKLKKLLNDPCYIRKRTAFYSSSIFWKGIYSNLSMMIKEEFKHLKEDLVYPLLFSIYNEENKIDSAYFYIKELVEGKDYAEIYPWILSSYAKIAFKKNEIEKSKLAYGYLIFYHGLKEYADTLKEILKEDYEKEIKKMEKEIQKRFKKIPEFELTLLDGSIFKYKENKNKIIVFNFWYTGCGGCVKEIPKLNELAKRFKDNKDVIFIAVTREDKKTIENFLKKQNFDYLLAINDEDLHIKLGVHVFPTHLIVDKKGRIVCRILGALPEIDKKIEEKIYRLLEF